ncbi:hypothetical protein QE392_002538 [Microbacterium proteolyticum]|nr:hypothetical protein [Microbacterium sp. SORGH_AS_0344]MDQ1170734.1 hypothetical protein [Microbacterium proteolyticum]
MIRIARGATTHGRHFLASATIGHLARRSRDTIRRRAVVAGRHLGRWQRGQKWLERFMNDTRTIGRPHRGQGWPVRP